MLLNTGGALIGLTRGKCRRFDRFGWRYTHPTKRKHPTVL